MKRRSFLGWVGVGAIASSLPMAIAACSQTSESVSTDTSTPENAASTTADTAETVASADGFEELGTVAELDETGFLVNTVSDTKVIVVRDPENAETLIARNALCTHKECTVDWQAESSDFFCACHDSKFALDGSAIEGPASEPLANYEAKIEGDRVLVNVG
jgi:cytochrome b6-f complex iron-sulfur subunit